ncbi:MAG TPA: hypothetical protein VL333_13110 [Candidatus Saccharimonadales bacterium]|jgi:hypothetical protein|nr:hypothetical protein [Candidatus Saccharimonadales bacterium]
MMLATVLSSGVRAPETTHPDNAARIEAYNATMQDMSALLKQVARDYSDERLDITAYINLLKSMGAERVIKAIETSSYMSLAFDMVNRAGVGAIQGMATAGDPTAIGWWAEHVDEIGDDSPSRTVAKAIREAQSVAHVIIKVQKDDEPHEPPHARTEKPEIPFRRRHGPGA